MGHCGVNYDPLPRVRPEAGAMRRERSTNGDIRLIPMLQRRKAMTESAQSFADVADDARVSETPLVDKGFASVRKIGNGLYATISDLSKGNATLCNGGFLVGRDAALLVEGFATQAGAYFQMEAMRMDSQATVKAELVTHNHHDHTLGNAFY